MPIPTHLYPHNLPLSFPVPLQHYCFMDNIHNTNINNNLFIFQQKQSPPYHHQQHHQPCSFQFQLHRHQHRHQPCSFQFQLQQQPCSFQFQHLQNPPLACYNGFVNNLTPTTTTASVDQKPPFDFSHGFSAQLDNFSQEVDRYIVSQNERLKVALQEETKKQMGEIWRKLEAKGTMLVQQKKQEIVKAAEKRRELEERIIKMEAEKEAWKRMAVENESMVISLNNTFEQVKEESGYCPSSNGGDDAESCCDDNENMYKNKMGIKCRVCMSEEATVVLLPCRHLCCCIACNTCLDACPLCHSLNKASIQPLFS